MARAFVIRPFGKQSDPTGREIDFDRVHTELITRALEQTSLVGGTTGDIVEAGNIRKDMFQLIVEADLVLCDFSIHNANVFYELGIRHALRKGHTILLRSSEVVGAPPFDVLTERYIKYDDRDPSKSVDALCASIRATLDKPVADDSPVFQYVPQLSDAGQTVLNSVPADLAEEIERARQSEMKGWLRLLSSDIRGKRFEWNALRRIAKGMWGLHDLDEAIKLWLQVREREPNDVDANLALANLYERKYRIEQQPDLLTRSEQALARVLQADVKLNQNQRAEALALVARNEKTRWRLGFQAPTSAERRSKATNQRVLRSYEHYRKAFLTDLNHYWSGLAAIQMGFIASSLSEETAWNDLFDEEADAGRKAAELNKQIATMRQAIELALSNAPEQKDRWFEISKADLKFLFDDNPQRVKSAYENAILEADGFAREAMKGQLLLFAALEIKRELAERIIGLIDMRATGAQALPLTVVVFAGHQIDEPGRAAPRFPVAEEPRARALIRTKLLELKAEAPALRVLASASPGGDILCHELCKELEIESIVCLPMPREVVARDAYAGRDRWRSRYFTILEQRQVLQLSDEEGLPRWLRSSDIDPWERGNRWTLEMARSSGAKFTKLVALWDRQTQGERRGGTAHAVAIAEQAGDVDIEVIDASELIGAASQP